MDIELYIIYLSLAFTFHFISWRFPFREQASNSEKRWDLVAVLAGKVFSLTYIALIGAPVFLLLTHETALVQWRDTVNSWPVIVSGLAQILLIDFLLYWVHRSLHHQWLWHTHAFHHAPKHLWWMSGLRASPMHVVMMSLPFTISLIIFPTPEGAIITTIAIFVRIANQHWLHSNVKVPFEKHLEWVLVTPRLHFIHHSTKRKFSDSNYGFLFSCWDRIFGTLTTADQVPKNDKLGLNYDNTNMRLIFGLPPKSMQDTAEMKQAVE